MNLCEQKHTSQVHLLKLRNIIAVLKKPLSVIVLSCKPVTSKNVIFVDQTQPASQSDSHPACHPELYRLQCSTLHKCNVDAKIVESMGMLTFQVSRAVCNAFWDL